MPTPDNPEANTDTGGPAALSLRWFFTESYRHTVPLDAVAAAVGCTAEGVAADPASLLGVVGDRLANLLTGYQTPERTVDVPEVEIEVTSRGGFPPMEKTEATGRLAEKAKAIASELGFAVEDAATGGASDANPVAGLGVPTLDGLGPIGGADHAPGEWLDLDSVVPCIALLAGMIATSP